MEALYTFTHLTDAFIKSDLHCIEGVNCIVLIKDLTQTGLDSNTVSPGKLKTHGK